MKKLFVYAGLLILVACGFLFAQPAPIRTIFFWQLVDTPSTYSGQADKILQVNSGATAVEFTSLSDLITLGTDTTGNYVATISDAGNSVITVTGSGSESAAVTLDITNNGIVEADLKAVDSATDEDIFTYESTTGDFEWHTIVQMLALTDTDSLSEGSTNLYANTEEEIEDFVGGMLGGTETDISVTYQDATNDIDFVVTSLVDIVTTSPLTVNAGANLDDVIVGSDADITLAVTILKDIVTTAPLTGAEDNVLPGADADLTLAITVLKDLVTTAPVTGGTNDILTGADADITIALDFTAAWAFDGNLSIGNATTTAGVLTLLEDDDDGSNFASFMVPALAANTVYTLPPDDGDNTEVLQTNGSGTLTWVANAGGGATAWDDISDPDNNGLTTITFDNAELSLFTGDNDAAASFFTIQNSDADHTGGNLYLLDLDYSADDGDADADFVKLQDSGGVVLTIQEEGKIVMTPGGVGSLDAISVTPSAALSTNEASWNAFKINSTALDPSGDDILLCGVNVDMSGVVFGGTGGDIDGIGINMAGGEEHAIHISQGKVVLENTVAATAGAEFTIIDIQVHTASMNANSSIHAIDVATPETPAGTVVAVGTHSNIEVIQQSIGTFSTPSQTEYAGEKHTGGTVWVDGVDTSEIFVVDDDEVYVGSTAQFSEIDVIMATPGSKTITPTFHYNTAADAWTEFFPADDTDGFQQSGIIRWTLADISGSWTNDGDPGGADSSAGYWIKVIRTANADPGTPTPTTVKTGAITLYSWSKTGAVDILSMEADTITEGGVAVYNDNEIDEFSEIDAIVADKSLVNLEDGGTFTGGLIANANLSIGNATTTAGVLTLLEDDDDGSNFASFMVPALGANTVYTLPPDDGDNTEVLQTDGSGTLTWVANAGSSTAWDDIGDPDADGSIAFGGYEQIITSTLDETGHVVFKIDHTDADVANQTTLFQIQSVDDADASLYYIIILDDSGGTPNIVFSVGADGVTTVDGNITSGGTIEGATLTEGGVAVITEADIPAAGTDPDVDAAGEIGRDTDGANETGDSSLRGHDGSAQFLYAAKIKYLDFTLIEPDGIDAADLIPIWLNTTGMTATFLEWHGFSDDDDVSLEFECLTDRTDFTAITTMDAVEIATDGTGVYYASDATWTSATVAHDDLLAVDFDVTDTPDYVKLSASYWLNSDVD